jgi:hypothetical protein
VTKSLTNTEKQQLFKRLCYLTVVKYMIDRLEKTGTKRVVRMTSLSLIYLFNKCLNCCGAGSTIKINNLTF